MSIREKLLDFKRRLSDRKMYSIVVVVIAAVAIWGIYQYKHAANLRQELDNQYNRAFYEMTGYVNNVEVLLVKTLVASTPDKAAATLQEAWRQANLAQTNLGQLPVSPQVLENTSKFLVQVGDLAYSLNNQNMDGKPLSDDQYTTLESLHGYAVSLGSSLNEFQSQLSVGRIRWGQLARKGTPLFQKTSSNMPAQQVENIDKTFQDYPKLIYDGPFSDHLVTVEPRGVTGPDLTSEEVKQSVISFFGADKVKSVNETGRNDTGPINTYTYAVGFNDAPQGQTATIEMTQKGGHVFQMLYNRDVPAENINVDQAKAIGRDFLNSRGYTNMIDTYYLKEDNTAVINYAYKQDNVVVYPDLIKLKIALDNGEIVGMESKSYLAAHIIRTIPAAKITEQQARASVTSRIQIVSSGLAMIPTDYKTELLTYEFKGKTTINGAESDILVYINAQTGKEEKALIIVNTPNGILTM